MFKSIVIKIQVSPLNCWLILDQDLFETPQSNLPLPQFLAMKV